MPARRYVALQTGKTGVLLALEAPQSAPGTPGSGKPLSLLPKKGTNRGGFSVLL